jgi:hypothetical protein
VTSARNLVPKRDPDCMRLTHCEPEHGRELSVVGVVGRFVDKLGARLLVEKWRLALRLGKFRLVFGRFEICPRSVNNELFETFYLRQHRLDVLGNAEVLDDMTQQPQPSALRGV